MGKAVLERELNWFQQFQTQRTKYILHAKSNTSSRINSGHSSANSNVSSHSHTHSHVQPQMQTNPISNSMANCNNNQSQNEIVEQQQRMNAFQAHVMQQQMMQQNNYNQQQQQAVQMPFDQRARSQSYPSLPVYHNTLHHTNSFGNMQLLQQQQQMQQNQTAFVQNMNQHQQYQQIQQVQMIQNAVNINPNQQQQNGNVFPNINGMNMD